jgi:hypothetical protein
VILTILSTQLISFFKYIKYLSVFDLNILSYLKVGQIEEVTNSFRDPLAHHNRGEIFLSDEVKEHYSDQLSDRPFVDLSKISDGMERDLVTNRKAAQFKFHTAHLTDKDGYKSIVQRSIFENALSVEKTPLNTAQICTFGSCFAENLSRALGRQGITSTTLFIEDSVNSTYANMHFLEAALNRGSSPAIEDVKQQYDQDFLDKTRHRIEDATDLILTVGVAPCYFNKSGEFKFPWSRRIGGISLRTTTISENKQNLTRIFSLITEINPNARLFLTVSPVPLAGTKEMKSAVVADAISKSVIRASVHEFLGGAKGIHYCPAFEAVKWVLPHSTVSTFDPGDNTSRHVSDWVIDFVVGSFIKQAFILNTVSAFTDLNPRL